MVETPLTQWLQAWQAAPGDRQAADRLAQAVYAQLRDIASARLRREASAQITPTELVHETWLRLNPPSAGFGDRQQFFRLASVAMRNFLVDQARERMAQRHGGGQLRVTLSLADVEAGGEAWPDRRLLDFDRALERLAQGHPRAAETIVLRCFGGLSLEEIADCGDASLATVKRDLAFARAWLTDALATTEE